MKIKYRIQLLVFMIISLFLMPSCKQDSQPKREPPAAATSKPYSNKGLSLEYPHYWQFAYDDSPSLYADRGVSFHVSESSGAGVFIYKDRAMDLSRLADYYEHSLKLKTTEHIKNYHRGLIEIEGYQGGRLGWKNTLIGNIAVEITILQLPHLSDPTFVVFHLLDEDINRESPNFIAFMNSISLQ